MATLGMIISRMRAAGESQEDIDATRAEYEKLHTPKPRPDAVSNAMAGLELPRGNPQPVEPTDFWGGFGESLRSGEALETGLRGAKGFARGAIADLPSSIGGMLKTGAGLMSFGNPERQVEAGRELFEGLKALPGHIAERTRFAATQPEEFGRTAGQLMGQPAVGEAALIGGLGAARGLRVPAANALSSVGRGLEGAKPVQGMPVTPRGAISTVVRGAVGPVGRTMQRTGEAMRLKASGVESAGSFANRKPNAPAPPAISRGNLERVSSEVPANSQPPIVEDLQSYAGRGGSGSNPQPSVFDNPPAEPIEIDPMFRTAPPPAAKAPGGPNLVKTKVPPVEDQFGDILSDVRERLNRTERSTELPTDVIEPDVNYPTRAEPLQNRPEGANLVKDKVPSVEQQIADLLEQVRNESAVEPGVELPPAPYSLGETAAPAQPRVNINAPKSPVVEPPPPLPEGTNLIKEKVPTVEEQIANLLEQVRNESRQAPGVELPPPDYSLGAPAAPAQPRVNVNAPKASKEFLAEKARTNRLNRAAEKLKAKEAAPEGVDTTTGEIIEPPPPEEAFTRELPADEPTPTRSAFGADEPGFWADEAGSKEIPGWANKVASIFDRKPGANPNRSMFENSARIGAEEAAAAKTKSVFSDQVAGANEFSPDLVAQSENVLEGASPTFAPRGFKAGDTVKVGGKGDLPGTHGIWDRGGDFEDGIVQEVLPNGNYSVKTPNGGIMELSSDWVHDPNKLNVANRTTPREPMLKPGETIGPFFDEATEASMKAKATPPPTEGPFAKKRPGLLEDERGAVGPDIGDKRWSVKDLSGKTLGKIEVTAKDIQDIRTKPEYKHVSEQFEKDTDLAQWLFESNREELLAENGLSLDDLPRVKVEEIAKSRLVKKPGEDKPKPKAAPKAEEKKEPAAEPKIKIDKPNTSVQPPIATPASFEGMPRSYKLKDRTNVDAIQAGRRKGYHLTYNEEGEVVMVRGDLIASENMPKAPETAKAEPAPVKAEKSGLDPDKAFAPGGDPEPIREAIFQLRSVGAADARYKQLLPTDKQGPLAKGETYRERVTRLFTHPTKAEVAKKAEVENFVKSVEATRQPRPVEAEVVSDIPPLRAKDTVFKPSIPKPIRRNNPAAANSSWISPRQRDMLRQMRKKQGD